MPLLLFCQVSHTHAGSAGIWLRGSVCSVSAVFTPFNPFSMSHLSLLLSHLRYRRYFTLGDIVFISICSLLKGASADVALHTARLQGSCSKAVPCCNLCSHLSAVDAVRYSATSAKWKDFQEGMPIRERGQKGRRI